MDKNSKNRKKFTLEISQGRKLERFGLIHPRSDGIDIGSMLMVVSYTDHEDMVRLREFDSFTRSLVEVAELLQKHGVEQVAMEATGPYWMSLYNILELHGLKVIVINPSHYRNVSAQKTDVNDAQWLHQLLAHGLLRHSHIAPELYRELRRYLHERGISQKHKSDTLNRIQKMLTMMNIKFQHLISDIEGVAGMKLLRAITSGLSDGQALLNLIDLKRLKARPQDLLSSLQGDYREDYIIILSMALKSYDFFKGQMLDYESYIEGTLKKLLATQQPSEVPKVETKKGMVRKNQYSFDVKEYLEGIFGVDLTAVEGVEEASLLTILSVTGNDMGKWPTAGHFTSWLNLSPRPKISGGKVIGYEKRATNNPATQAFRMAANSLWQSKGPMGQQYRKLAATKGSKKAIKAVARKIAVIFYNMVLKKQTYDPKKILPDIEKQTARRINRLQKEAAKLGLTLQNVA